MPSSTRRFLRPTAALVLAVGIGIIALPREWKAWAPRFLRDPALHLGLDLVGGTQLDFRISEEELRAQKRQVEEELAKIGDGNTDEANRLRAEKLSIQEQESNLVEAIRTVIERRINALGVSEATITPSYVGNEKHLLVECPGIVKTQECINVVGKTIQLEFKEEFSEATEEFEKGVRQKAEQALRRVTVSGATLEAVGQDISTQLGVLYQSSLTSFRDQLPQGLEELWKVKPGKIILKEGVLRIPSQTESGQQQTEEVRGIFLAEVLRPLTQTGRILNEAPKAFGLLSQTMTGTSYAFRDETPLEKVPPRIAGTLRAMQGGELRSVVMEDGSARILFLRLLRRGEEEVAASHILVSYAGASGAGKEMTRTREQARARAKELKARLDRGENFERLARAESDGPSRAKGGSLGTFGRGTMVPAFEQVVFSRPAGSVSDPVETQFGYHLIRVDKTPALSSDRASFDELTLIGMQAPQRAEELLGKLRSGEVKAQEEAATFRMIFFSLKPTGWKDTPLDGKHFRAANVSTDPVTNLPVVQILFDGEGGKMFQELTKRNVGKRIAIFVGGELVSAPVVQAEISGGSAVITGSSTFDEARQLALDLNTGAIPAPIHLVGQYTVEATLGAAALRTSLLAAFLGTLVLMLYMAAVYRLLGIIADIALTIYGILLFAILKLPLFFFTNNYIVLTLAGMAGIILSIGMAVDANVLVFERMREEMRKGKILKTAVESSFRYAWPAIRDSNVSAIITCVILFLVGTSIVRGFAVTLGLGVCLSLFTAVTVTRWMLRRLAELPIGERKELFGVKEIGGGNSYVP